MYSFVSKYVLALPVLVFLTSCGSSDFSSPIAGGKPSTQQRPVSSPAPITSPDPQSSTADQTLKTVQPGDPNALTTDVEFGGDKVFRIGDNDFSGSSCYNQLDAYPISGTTYLFEFTVLENGTNITMEIDQICGVDYDLQNIAGIQKDGSYLTSQKIKKTDTMLQFGTQTLDAGKYSVVVQSIEKKTGILAKDYDDFIVGKIHVKADKKISPGAITAK